MSDSPTDPPLPPPGPELELTYQTPERVGNAPTLVKLAAIFNMVSACLDLVYVLLTIGMGLAFYYAATTFAPLVGPGAGPAPPTVLLTTYFLLSFIIPGCLSFLVMIPKMIGGIQLLRLGRGVWGWGLAAGICGAIQIWTFRPCCFPVILFMGAGIYTIVVMCLPHVRGFLTSASVRSGWRG